MADIVNNGINLTVDSAIKFGGAIAGQVGLEQIGFLANNIVSIGPFLGTGGSVAAIHVARVARDWLYNKTLKSTVENHMNKHVIKFTAEVIDFATIAGLSFAAVSIAPAVGIAAPIHVLGLITLVYVGDKAHSFIKPFANDIATWVQDTVANLTSKAPEVKKPEGGAPEGAAG